MTIHDLFAKYFSKLDRLDLELISAHIIKKSREFVLAHPEYEIPKLKIVNCKLKIARRMNNEPLAYILGHKEFYRLDFKVNKHTLIPRPETELLVELAMQEVKSMKKVASVVDVGTGSGNIIISLAKNLQNKKIKYFGVDISKKALQVAKYNAKKNKVNKKINFLHGDLLNNKKLFNKKTKKQFNNLTIIANLPYLSKKNYGETLPNVKNYEPKSALYSSKNGLWHYEKLLQQIKNLHASYSPALPAGRLFHTSCFLEFSPEQKNNLKVLIKKILPSAQIEFKKDLAKKWRVCTIKLS